MPELPYVTQPLQRNIKAVQQALLAALFHTSSKTKVIKPRLCWMQLVQERGASTSLDMFTRTPLPQRITFLCPVQLSGMRLALQPSTKGGPTVIRHPSFRQLEQLKPVLLTSLTSNHKLAHRGTLPLSLLPALV